MLAMSHTCSRIGWLLYPLLLLYACFAHLGMQLYGGRVDTTRCYRRDPNTLMLVRGEACGALAINGTFDAGACSTGEECLAWGTNTPLSLCRYFVMFIFPLQTSQASTRTRWPFCR